MENLKHEVLLHFEYCGSHNIENAKRLCKLLKESNIDFCVYITDDDYYRPSFYVRRCGKKWSDIMHIINLIQAPRYKKQKETFRVVNVTRAKIGNIELVCL